MRLLNHVEKHPPPDIQRIAAKSANEVWKDIDCLSCANCCKVMTPTYTGADLRRIAGHLGMTVDSLKEKWLKKEKSSGDWINRNTPCQFLDLTTNRCSIYSVRPADCAGFPHLGKRNLIDYVHVHKQNIDECPATFKMVERMRDLISFVQN